MLEVNNIYKSYNDDGYVLHDVSVNVNKGEIVGLVGLNGAGKSTLMKSIAGIINVNHGNIMFSGKNIETLSENEKKKISFLSTNNNLYSELSVKENIEIFRRIYYKNESDVKSIVDILGIDSFLNKTVKNLSTGMKKKAEIACATLGDYELLMLDEPTNGLDIEAKSKILNYFKWRLTKDNGILITSHNINDIEQLCDRVYIIREGKIILETSIFELKEYSRKYMNNANLENVILSITNRGQI